MAKSKKKKPLPPRVKRMKRPARLESAKKWIPTYSGKHLLRGYCNHYGVNWRCAALELEMLGHKIDPEYLATRERTEAALVKRRQAKKTERQALLNEHWHPFSDAFSAYLDGDYPAMHDLQMREQYGDNWEDHITKDFIPLEDGIEEEYDEEEYDEEAESLSQTAHKLTLFDPDNDDDWIPF